MTSQSLSFVRVEQKEEQSVRLAAAVADALAELELELETEVPTMPVTAERVTAVPVADLETKPEEAAELDLETKPDEAAEPVG